MQQDRHIALATATVFATGAFWGFYWLPVRILADAGLPGAWGTFAITLAATILLLPVVVRRWRGVSRSDLGGILSVAIGGAAFALYSVGFLYGRVAIIILLYFLTPVWSTLIARYVMGWETPRLRIFAIGAGLAGLALMLGAEGDLPLPTGAGEWMALVAGILWSIGTTGIAAKASLAPPEATFVFALAGCLTALSLAPFLEPFPRDIAAADLGHAAVLATATGLVWWCLSVAGLLWATARLEPARVGIILMVEVLVGAVSAAVLAGESLSPIELAGGALVLIGGVLEIWPVPRPRGPPTG
ncbi:DMT family transporter [Tabrizicola sp. BL-A-41-H6]|uniref:DMT family transporter n=1 Tax=Tabrizicola sp. BL-A-41-H6 TaxID=3421107 RepID=UPI003D67DA36